MPLLNSFAKLPQATLKWNKLTIPCICCCIHFHRATERAELLQTSWTASIDVQSQMTKGKLCSETFESTKTWRSAAEGKGSWSDRTVYMLTQPGIACRWHYLWISPAVTLFLLFCHGYLNVCEWRIFFHVYILNCAVICSINYLPG